MLDDDFEDLKELHLDLAKMVADRAEALAPVRTGRLKEPYELQGRKQPDGYGQVSNVCRMLVLFILGGRHDLTTLKDGWAAP